MSLPTTQSRRFQPILVRAALLVVLAAICPFAAGQETPPDFRELRRKGLYAEALAALAKELEGHQVETESPAPFIVQAQLLFSVGKVDEAIALWERIAARYPDPAHSIPLADMYRYRGRLDDFKKALADAARQAESSVHHASVWDNVIAVARMMELQKENPRLILNMYFPLYLDRLPKEPAAYVMAGDIAYRKYGYDVAAGYYNQALAIDVTNQDALAGLAECYWKAGDPRLEETVKRLAAVNPNHPRAIAIEVAKLLDLGEAAQALDLIERRLKVNPNDLQYLGMRAAAKFLQDELDEVAATQRKALAFNPHASDAYTIPARVAARHYRFAEAVAMLRKALEADPEDAAARSELAFNLLRLGEQTEGREQLDAAFKADAFNVQAFNLLEVMDALAKFETVKQDAFEVSLPLLESRILAPAMLDLLEEEIKVYEAKYQVRLARPVLIQMFDDHDEFMVRSVGLPGNTGHLGICFGKLITMDSPRARPPGGTNWRSVLWHEFVHVITLQKTKNRMPRWLSEGISVYEETQKSPAWGQRLDMQYKPILAQEGLPGLGQLEFYFTAPKSAIHLMLGYYMAGEFAAFYAKEYGDAALVKSLDLIAGGMKAEPALVQASGVSRDKLDASFKAHLEQRTAALANIPNPPIAPVDADAPAEPKEDIPVETRPIPANWMSLSSPWTDAMKAGAAAMEAEKLDEAEQAFLKADALFPDYIAANSPLRALLAIYRRQLKDDKIEETLRKIVERDGTAYEEGKQLVALYKERKDWDGVVKAADFVYAINPFDVANLNDWHAGLVAKEDPRGALATSAQLRWLDPARESDYRVEHARLLAKVGEEPAAKKEAIALLEQMPHFWDAQKLLLELTEPKAPVAP